MKAWTFLRPSPAYVRLRPLPASIAVAALVLVPAARSATVPECQARVLQPVTDDMGHAWQIGAVVPVDIARGHGEGGQFCAHGGACLPRQTARGQAAMRLTNCAVGPSIGGGDFRLVPDARLAGAAVAAAMSARADVESKLSALGFSNAAAGSLAEESVSHPHSRRAQEVRRALAGSQQALRALRAQFP